MTNNQREQERLKIPNTDSIKIGVNTCAPEV